MKKPDKPKVTRSYALRIPVDLFEKITQNGSAASQSTS